MGLRDLMLDGFLTNVKFQTPCIEVKGKYHPFKMVIGGWFDSV